jgi:hypothetical protein
MTSRQRSPCTHTVPRPLRSSGVGRGVGLHVRKQVTHEFDAIMHVELVIDPALVRDHPVLAEAEAAGDYGRGTTLRQLDTEEWSRVAIEDFGAGTLVVIDDDPAQTIRLKGIGNAATITQNDFLLAVI